MTITANQQLAIQPNTPISFYYNNPLEPGASYIITQNIPCFIAAGSSDQITIELPVNQISNIYAVLNDDGSQNPPFQFPVTDIAETIFSNNIDNIAICSASLPTVSVNKQIITPIPACGNTVIYQVDVCNVGSQDALGVWVNDIAPSGFTLTNINIPSDGCATGTNPFDIPSSCCVSLILEYNVDNAGNGNYNSQDVELSGPTGQTYLNFDGSSSSSEDLSITGDIDCPSTTVLFSKSVNTTETCEDSFVTYEFIIDNQTDVALQGLNFSDQLPENTSWTFEPYFLENVSIANANISGNSLANFTISEIAPNSVAVFYMDAAIGDWTEQGLLPNTATISGFPEFVNDGSTEMSASSETVFVSVLPEITSANEITIQEGELVSLSATLNGAATIEWTSGGDGTFADATALNTVYTPGPLDEAQGSVNLTVAAISDNGCGQSLQSLTVTIEEIPGGCDVNLIMPATPLFICTGEDATIEADLWLPNLEDDVLQFVLHTGGGNQIVEPSLTMTANTFGLPDGFIQNTQYYFSAISGQDLDQDGLVDLADSCRFVSAGTPVVFLEPIVVSGENACDGDLGIVTLAISIEGGLPAFLSSSEYEVSGDFTANLTADQAFFVVEISDAEIFNFGVSDGNCGESSSEFGPYNCSKLSLELLEFTGKNQEGKNQLKFLVASEEENDHFLIEKSVDGSNFERVGTVTSIGNHTTATTYFFIDEDLKAAAYYYRLSWIDISGKQETAEQLVYLKENALEEIRTYPNPVQDYLEIEGLNKEEVFEYFLYDSSGKLLQEGKQVPSKPRINFSKMQAGIYFIEIRQGSHSYQRKIRK